MRREIYLLIGVFLLLTSTTIAFAGQTVDDFSSATVGKFPSSWRTWPFQRGKATEVYKVEQEGDLKFLHAFDDKDYSVQIMRDFGWHVENYPYLSWKWRARKLPEDAREDDDNKNDNSCGVYVIIGRAIAGKALKYAWSTSLPVGSVVTRRDGKLKIKIVQSGAAKLNEWQYQTVNVPADYKELFGEELKKNPSGIAILTDGNATHTAASCDYADFTVSGK